MLTNQLVQSNPAAACAPVETFSLALFLDIGGPLYHVISTVWISILVCSTSKWFTIAFVDLMRCCASVIVAIDYLIDSSALLFTHFGQEPSELTAAGRGEAPFLPAITDGKRYKKEGKHEKETDPRPPFH